MTDWREGDECRMVQVDPRSGSPVPGGEESPATVKAVRGDLMTADVDDWGPLLFSARTGFGAWCHGEDARGRQLMPLLGDG